MDISRRNMLLAASTAAIFGSSTRARAATAPKYFIVVLANGGWDVTYCLDPKLGNPNIDGPEDDVNNASPGTEGTESFGDGAITVASNPATRPNVAAFFGDNDRWQRCHVANGIWTGSIAHAPCRLRMFAGSTYDGASDPATIFGYATGQSLPLGTVDMSGLSFPGALAASTGRIGFQSQIKALVDPGSDWQPPTGAVPYSAYRQSPDEREAVYQYLTARAAAYEALRGEAGHNSHLVDGLLESLDRAKAFTQQSGQAMSDLTLGVIPSFEQQIDMAADLLQQGLCKSVVLNSGSDWDTHISNNAQHGFYDGLFGGLIQLFDDLMARGMFEDTVVAVLSEMTRTPKLNKSIGKDHHAHTSALFFGGPVRGGVTSGATDDLYMESQFVDLATGEVKDIDPTDTGSATNPDATYNKYDTLSAGLVQMLGLDPQEWFPGVTPFTGFIEPS